MFFSHIPSSWIRVSFSDIGEINPKSIDKDLHDDDEVTFTPMRCVSEMGKGMDISIVKKYSEVKKGYTPFIDGDLLVAKITPCMENGKVVIADKLKNGVGFGSTEFHTIRFQNEIEKKLYYFYFLRADIRKDAQRHMTGTAGQLRVPSSFITNLSVPLPPLPEQHRIVTKIEELFTQLDTGVASLKKVQAQLKRYRQAVLKAAFEGRFTQEWREEHRGEICKAIIHANAIIEERQKNQKSKRKASPEFDKVPSFSNEWIWTRLDLVCNKIQDGMHFSPPIQYDQPEKGRYPYITAKNIKDFGIDLTDVTYIDEKYHRDIFSRCNPEYGDVLLTKDGVKTGEVCVNQLTEEFSLLSSVALLKPNKELLNSRFLKYYLASPLGFTMIVGQMTGVAIKRIILEKIKKSPIIIPTLPEQLIIVTEIDRRLSIADEIEQTIGTSLRQADSLHQSILKQAFEGKLVPQDPNDEPASVLLDRIKDEKARHQTEAKKVRNTQRKPRITKVSHAH